MQSSSPQSLLGPGNHIPNQTLGQFPPSYTPYPIQTNIGSSYSYPHPQNFRNHPPQGFSRKNRQRSKKGATVSTPLTISIKEMYQHFLSSGHLTPLPALLLPPNFQSDLRCAYHSNQLSHRTEKCCALKRKIQDIVNPRKNKGAKQSRVIASDPFPSQSEVIMISEKLPMTDMSQQAHNDLDHEMT